jgi:hypothetical protein
MAYRSFGGPGFKLIALALVVRCSEQLKIPRNMKSADSLPLQGMDVIDLHSRNGGLLVDRFDFLAINPRAIRAR